MHIDLSLTIEQMMTTYGISRASAYRYKGGAPARGNVGRPTIRVPKGLGIALDDAQRIARLSAQYVVGKRSLARDPDGYDRYQECYQCALIELWISGADTLPLAFKAARRACLNVTRTWNKSHKINARHESYSEDDNVIE